MTTCSSPNPNSVRSGGYPATFHVGVRTVGIDYLSIGREDEGPAVHRALLGAEILIVEGLNFSGVEPGDYDFVCLPLKIRGGDGAPARALLKRRGDPARGY